MTTLYGATKVAPLQKRGLFRKLVGWAGWFSSRRWDSGEEDDEGFGQGGVGDDEVAESGVGQVVGHGELNGWEEFACSGAEGGEAEDAVVFGDEGLDEAAGLGEGAGAEDGQHGDLDEAVGDSLVFGFGFGEAELENFDITAGSAYSPP